MEKMIYLKNVATLQLSENNCSGCGMCMVVCPHAVFSMNNGKARIVNRDACMECGACAMNCPTGALAVQAGVGCAAAVIISALGREGSCCCVIENQNEPAESQNDSCC